jgi:hypothetical protein
VRGGGAARPGGAGPGGATGLARAGVESRRMARPEQGREAARKGPSRTRPGHANGSSHVEAGRREGRGQDDSRAPEVLDPDGGRTPRKARPEAESERRDRLNSDRAETPCRVRPEQRAGPMKGPTRAGQGHPPKALSGQEPGHREGFNSKGPERPKRLSSSKRRAPRMTRVGPKARTHKGRSRGAQTGGPSTAGPRRSSAYRRRSAGDRLRRRTAARPLGVQAAAPAQVPPPGAHRLRHRSP